MPPGWYLLVGCTSRVPSGLALPAECLKFFGQAGRLHHKGKGSFFQSGVAEDGGLLVLRPFLESLEERQGEEWIDAVSAAN